MHQNNLIPSGAVAVTTNDTAYVNYVGVFVGGAGNLVVTGGDGNDVTFTGMVAGQIIPMRIIRVKTSTTATNIVGFVA